MDKATKAVRAARYLKDTKYHYPHVSKEEFAKRKALWNARDMSACVICVSCGLFGVLRYLFPHKINFDIPYDTFLGFGYVPRCFRTAAVPRLEPKK